MIFSRRKNRRQLSLFDPRRSLRGMLVPLFQSPLSTATEMVFRFYDAAGPESFTVAEYTGGITIHALKPLFADNNANLIAVTQSEGPGGVTQMHLHFDANLNSPDGCEIYPFWPTVRGVRGQWVAPIHQVNNVDP